MKLWNSLTNRPRSQTRSGMTLVETLVGLTAGMLLMAVVASMWMFSARSFVAIGNYTDMDNASRNTLDLMSREIRAAAGLTSYDSDAITLTNLNGTSFSYVYDPASETLSRVQGGTSRVLLEQCDYVRFNVSQRNITNGFIFYSTKAQPSLTKLVDVSWKCSRKILGAKVNTESVQTAKIVLRN
jgi:hypothetical protein